MYGVTEPGVDRPGLGSVVCRGMYQGWSWDHLRPGLGSGFSPGWDWDWGSDRAGAESGGVQSGNETMPGAGTGLHHG